MASEIGCHYKTFCFSHYIQYTCIDLRRRTCIKDFMQRLYNKLSESVNIHAELIGGHWRSVKHLYEACRPVELFNDADTRWKVDG